MKNGETEKECEKVREDEKVSVKEWKGEREKERENEKKEEWCKWLRHLVWSWHFENLVA